MGHKIKSISLLVMLASLTSMGFASNQAFAGASDLLPTDPASKADPFLGDFMCYDINDLPTFLGEDHVILTDQFLTEVYHIDDAIKICTMTEKFLVDGVNPDTPVPQFFDFADIHEQHYLVYRLCHEDSPEFPFSCVTPDVVNIPVSIMDQFGTTEHTVPHLPVELWVPSTKFHLQCPQGYDFDTERYRCVGPPDPCPPVDPPDPFSPFLYELDDATNTCEGFHEQIGSFFQNQNIHFKCYDIEPKSIGTKTLGLSNENFAIENIFGDIDTATKLCNPVIKDFPEGDGLVPFQSLDIEHLKCYPWTDLVDMPDAITLFDNQFDSSLDIEVIDEIEFCAAADKFLLLGEAVGGTLIPIDTTPLLVSGTQMTASWMIPVIVSAVGIGLVFVRKSENS